MIEQCGDKAVSMAGVDIEFVSTVSATSQRNGAGFNPCQGLYFKPKGAKPSVAFIASHYNVDFSEHYLAPLMAKGIFGTAARESQAASEET